MHSVTQQVLDAVPFYAGLTVDTIGAKGTRWWEDAARADAWPAATAQLPPAGPAKSDDMGHFSRTPNAAATPNGSLRLGTFRSIWASPEVEASPALKFLHPRQKLELAPGDAERLGIKHGERVVVGADGASVEAVVVLRQGAPEGSVFLQTGIGDGAANVLEGPLVEINKVVTA